MPSTEQRLGAVAARGIALIRANQHVSGAYPASPTFGPYAGYAWFRDGAFVADGMSAIGEAQSATAFFDWCSATLAAESDAVTRIVDAALAGTPVPDGDMLATRVRIEPSNEPEPEWWDYQLDGFGLWMWAAIEHADRHHLDPARWAAGLAASADYLACSWARPCFDWWEENAGHVHGSTIGSIVAGLRAVLAADVLPTPVAERAAAAEHDASEWMRTVGVVDGHLAKWQGDDGVDASLAALVGPLRVVPPGDPVAEATVAAIERDLVVAGGTHRHLADTFYGGGQWPLLSCMLGLAHLELGQRARALELLEWAAATEAHSGTMPEQVRDHLLAPQDVDEWLERWGPSADPLLWSYGQYLRLAAALGIRPEADAV